jgi:hypothetical protein
MKKNKQGLEGDRLKHIFRSMPIPLNIALAGKMEHMSMLEAAKQRMLKREAARTRLESGEESQAFRAAKKLLQVRKHRPAELFSMSQRMRIVSLPADKTSFVIHGRVVDENGVGLPEWSLTITDESGENVGTQKTNQFGYFKIIFHSDKLKHTKSDIKGAKGRKPRGKKDVLEDEKVTHIKDFNCRIRVLDPQGEARGIVNERLSLGGVKYIEVNVSKIAK